LSDSDERAHLTGVKTISTATVERMVREVNEEMAGLR
jgi:hypothetical protein